MQMDSVLEKNDIRTEAMGIGTLNAPLRVCFVCSGNTCRSPMAQAVLNDMARLSQIPSTVTRRQITATSAGISALDGFPISENAVAALKECGINSCPDNDYINHSAKRIDESDFVLSDCVIGISSAHAMTLISAFPMYASKIFAMPEDIPDPYGMGIDEYVECLRKIRAGIEKMFFGDEHGH